MPKKTTTKKTVTYEAVAKVMGKSFKGKGKTVLEAIENINAGNVAGMVVLTVKKGDVSKDRVLPHVMAKRLFMTVGLTREVALKNVSLMFD